MAMWSWKEVPGASIKAGQTAGMEEAHEGCKGEPSWELRKDRVGPRGKCMPMGAGRRPHTDPGRGSAQRAG